LKHTGTQLLIQQALAMEAEDAKAAGALGYMARALTLATMPHRRTTDNEFERRNGAFTLTMLAPSRVGLPYGSVPRLLVAWLTTEAVRCREREIVLGERLSEFMAKLELVPTGGRWGTITRLRDQMQRLFASSVSCTYESGDRWSMESVRVADRADLWWSPKQPDQAALWRSVVVLGERFFDEAVQSPVPIDLRALKALRRSPMALDIYCWLTHRMSYLRKPLVIPWVALQTQFGSDYRLTRQFKANFLIQLKAVQAVYPEAKLESGDTGLKLKPSPTHIVQNRERIIEHRGG
jgi:hypothetical protein